MIAVSRSDRANTDLGTRPSMLARHIRKGGAVVGPVAKPPSSINGMGHEWLAIALKLSREL